ncbi:MAG: hypothetical protein KF912_02515 [Phycisphaeraceae bacterium]|nr:hypothetical protein [Phycisphaeraceae bacterium]MBX3366174.1 hypothetical protein [Phycisphaeraceae bacterium]QYK48670.1 MAG: hypothetical protein KF838_02180 [Phycisphaeraceae bacterium]
MIQRLWLIILAVAFASAGVASVASAQDSEEVSVRSVPVDASRVMSALKASETILGSGSGMLDTAGDGREASMGSMLRSEDPFNARAGVQVTGGLDQAVSASLNRSTLSRLDSVQTSGGFRVSAKSVIIRIVLGTVLVFGIGGLALVLLTRVSGGQSPELA